MTTQISGDTGVSQVQTGSINQDDLAANVVGKGPAFSAYASVATSLLSGTSVKVGFQTEEFDTSNCYDTGLSRFQPTVAGFYQIEGAVGLTNAANILIDIYKNGTMYKRGAFMINSVQTVVATLVYLNGSTDYVELWCFQNSTTQNNSTGAAFSYFQGFLARAA